MADSYKIVTFGCWNNKYNKDFFYLKKVAEKIKRNEANYNLMVILGDNYYPNKIKLGDEKYEFVNKDEIKEGFDILKGINLDKRFIFGNHDIVFVKNHQMK